MMIDVLMQLGSVALPRVLLNGAEYSQCEYIKTDSNASSLKISLNGRVPVPPQSDISWQVF